ncbi:hypothetical protein [Clostridium sp. CTA-7]
MKSFHLMQQHLNEYSLLSSKKISSTLFKSNTPTSIVVTFFMTSVTTLFISFVCPVLLKY